MNDQPQPISTDRRAEIIDEHSAEFVKDTGQEPTRGELRGYLLDRAREEDGQDDKLAAELRAAADSLVRGKALIEPTPPSCSHDLGITISVNELEPQQLLAVRQILEREIAALVERVNADTAALTGSEVEWHVSYDGIRECGAH